MLLPADQALRQPSLSCPFIYMLPPHISFLRGLKASCGCALATAAVAATRLISSMGSCTVAMSLFPLSNKVPKTPLPYRLFQRPFLPQIPDPFVTLIPFLGGSQIIPTVRGDTTCASMVRVQYCTSVGCELSYLSYLETGVWTAWSLDRPGTDRRTSMPRSANMTARKLSTHHEHAWSSQTGRRTAATYLRSSFKSSTIAAPMACPIFM